jgi:DMSO/TMAO reductase YedYZ molybdopterin-dependent catalytic subunit
MSAMTSFDRPSRREMLGTLAAAGAATLWEPGEVLARMAADVPCVAGGAAGELLGLVPLFRNRVVPGQFGVKYDGVGLDARLDTDLSLLQPDNLITPNELAYIRTEIPAAAANHQGPWTLDTSGLLATPAVLKLDDLTGLSKKMGPHLFECSGNGANRHFGLMSVAEWEGIPLAEVVARLRPSKDACFPWPTSRSWAPSSPSA